MKIGKANKVLGEKKKKFSSASLLNLHFEKFKIPFLR